MGDLCCHLAGELKADLVASMPVAHEVLAELAIREHDITEVEGSCAAPPAVSTTTVTSPLGDANITM